MLQNGTVFQKLFREIMQTKVGRRGQIKDLNATKIQQDSGNPEHAPFTN